MFRMLCWVGLHDWQEYKSGMAAGTFVTRSWCPRCRADSILFGTYRHVERGAWRSETPQEQAARFHKSMSELQAAVRRHRDAAAKWGESDV